MDRKTKRLTTAVIVLAVLLPVLTVAAFCGGIYADAVISDDTLKYKPTGFQEYSDCIEEEWLGFQSGIGYDEYQYDASYDSDFQQNGYYHPVTASDIAEMTPFVEDFIRQKAYTDQEGLTKEGCHLRTDMIDTNDYYF